LTVYKNNNKLDYFLSISMQVMHLAKHLLIPPNQTRSGWETFEGYMGLKWAEVNEFPRHSEERC
jgi:hypothetical protein